MKTLLSTVMLSICTLTTTVNASEASPTVYVNQHVGFNVEGYKYDQPALPCDVDKNLVDLLVKNGNKANLSMQAVGTKEEIQNGTVPVVLVDIEQLALKHNKSYGKSNNFNLTKIGITAAVLKDGALTTAKHTCALTSEDNLTMPTDEILLNHANVEVCHEAQKCLEDLSKDVIDWAKPQI